MVAAESSNQNFFSTTLSSSISDTDTTIPLTSLGNLTSPAYLVIDPESDTKREVIYADGTWTGAAAVLSTSANRGVDGSVSGAQSHNSGTTVVSVPLKQHLEDIHDRVDTHVHDGTTDDSPVATSDLTGHDKPTHDALALDHGSLSGLSDFTADHGTDHDAHDHSFVDHGTLAGLADFTTDHGTDHDTHDHSTALGTASLADLATTDHDLLTGLTDDDHTQYLNTTRHDVTTRHPTSVLGDGSGLGLRDVVYLTASGSFTKGSYPWLRFVRVICIGAGGGGGGATSGVSTQSSFGDGGGGGGAAIKTYAASALSSSESYTIGSGGSGGSGAAGSGGGSTTFKGLTGAGGGPGDIRPSTTSATAISQSNGSRIGGLGSGGDLNLRGESGTSGVIVNPGELLGQVGGTGGASLLGGGRPGNNNGNGTTANTPGAGGSGAAVDGTSGPFTGGDGADGLIIIELYA